MRIKRPISITFQVAATLLLLFVVTACSTKKNTFTRRFYHNLTTHYNIYWNGRESLREGEDILKTKAVDNYTKVLPVYNFGTDSEAQQVYPQMDRAIEKASIAIQKHSMRFGGEEKVKWIDDCYMLIGKAYFYKQEYFSARRTFNFVIRDFGKNDIKYDAMLWLAKTHIQTEEYEKAEPLLNLVSKDVETVDVPSDIVKELPQVYADLYVHMEEYDKAIDFIYEALSYNPERDRRTRMIYILAQIFQQNDDLNRASQYYAQVVKRNPPYEMAFQAKINLAKSYDAASGDQEKMEKLLTRMLRDEKNEEFLDQIYYALAEVALREGQTEKGIEYLTLSVETSVKNNYQKASSALRLADIYFEVPEYLLAQSYYDTASMFLPKDFPNYRTIETRTRILSDLVVHLVTIQHQDSLQRLAKMGERERNKIIDSIINEYRLEQQRLAEARKLQEALTEQEALAARNQAQGPGVPTGSPIGGPGREWYFYNDATKRYGYSEFLKKWGKRKLEDLWRLSNKQLTTFGFEEDYGEEGDTLKSDSLTVAMNDPQQREYYLKDLPFEPEQVDESNAKMMKAYFELGRLYFDGLADFEESKQAFETLLTRFPETEDLLRSYYYLYKIYEGQKNKEKKEYYKNLIINNYPDSDYAKVLLDPDYFRKKAEEVNRAEVLYEEAYKAFKSEQYFMVIARSDMALASLGDTNDLAPKFEYLKALSIGRVEVLDSLVSSLKRIIIKYPNSSVKTLSQQILMNILEDHPEFADSTFQAPGQEPVKISPYNFSAGSQHMFMLLVDSKKVRLNPLKVKISDFNQKYFSLENLIVNSIVLDNKTYMVTVGNFNNSEKASRYFKAINQSDYVFSDLDEGDFSSYTISTQNYPIFFREKNVDEYKEFFEQNYLQ